MSIFSKGEHLKNHMILIKILFLIFINSSSFSAAKVSSFYLFYFLRYRKSYKSAHGYALISVVQLLQAVNTRLH